MKVLTIFLLTILYVNLNAELTGQAKIDSLLKELPKANEDSNKVNLLVRISFNYYSINPSEGIKHAKSGLSLSEKLNWKPGIAKIYNSLGVLYAYGNSNYPEAITCYNKALKINLELGKNNEIAQNYNNIALIYQNQSNYREALNYFQKALKINEESKNSEETGNNLSNIGNIYINLSENLYAAKYYHKALNVFEESGNNSGVAKCYNSLGNIYSNLSDYSKSLEYYEKALMINKELNDKTGISFNLSNIGVNYLNISNYPKALEYFQEAIKINRELGNKKGIAANLNNIGLLYFNQLDYLKAIDYYTQALKINTGTENKPDIAKNYNNIGVVYNKLNANAKALEYYQKSLIINIETDNKSSIANNLKNIGFIYGCQSEYVQALEYFSKSIDIYKELDDREGIADNLYYSGEIYQKMVLDSNQKSIDYRIKNNLNKMLYLNKSFIALNEALQIYSEIGELNNRSEVLKILADSYKAKQDFKNAFESFKNYKEIQDSIFSMSKSKELAKLEVRQEIELKDNKIKLLQTEKKAQLLRSYLLFVGIIVLLGAFGVAFLRFREKKKLSEKLANKNTEIQIQKSLLEDKNEQIYSSMRYASTIQNSILPWENTLRTAFSDVLIFYKPKDIVSGDCYWYQEVDGIKFLAVIDCTGHGIPGSMLTVIAASALDDAVLSKRLTDTGKILTYINTKVTEVLNQRISDNQTRDGMELALIAVSENKIQFSGAGRPLYIKNGTFESYKTDRRGIAGSAEDMNYIFSSVEIIKTEDLQIYLTSDGFADQMNEQSKKYSSKRFAALLESISDKPLNEQSKILEYEFTSHKGSRDQIDDITVLGVRI